MKLNCKMNALLICVCTFLCLFYISQQKNAKKKKCQHFTAYVFKMFHFQKTFNHMQLVFKRKKNQALLSKFINIFMYVVKDSHGISI